MTITEFLQARIEEDQQLAQPLLDRSAPDAWDNPMETGNFWPEEVAFLDRHSPARVLAECAAKRAIIEQHEEAGPVCFACESNYPCATLRHLTAVYSDHPDCQKEWA